MNCTVYVNPNTIRAAYLKPAGLFPMKRLDERSFELEKMFDKGFYDAGVGDLATYGEYQDWSLWPPKPPLPPGWVWDIPDYPFDVVKDYPGNTRTPQKCLEDTDENLEYYRKYFTGGNGIATVQFLFGNADSLQSRLKGFLDKYGVAVFGIGNCCKLWKAGDAVQIRIGRAIVETCARYECMPHIFGCPTRLLDYLVRNAKFPFSADFNKYSRGRLPGETKNHLSRNINERTYFLHKYLVQHNLLDRRIIADIAPVVPVPVKRNSVKGMLKQTTLF